MWACIWLRRATSKWDLFLILVCSALIGYAAARFIIPVANTKWITHCRRHVMSSSNHHETLRWIWSSASALSLFLRHCISVFHCSLTNVRIQPALTKSNMRQPWPLCGSLSKYPGNKWDIWKGWVHMERWGSSAALCPAPPPPLCLIWLNW